MLDYERVMSTIIAIRTDGPIGHMVHGAFMHCVKVEHGDPEDNA